MKRTIFRVIKQGSQWFIKSNKNEVGKPNPIKAIVIDRAFRYAKKASPATVRIYSAAGNLQVESEW